jgi:fructose-bisphosphate aldolase class II
MPLVNLKDMLCHAHDHRYAVAAFTVDGLEFLAGYMQAAEQSRAPIILNIPESGRCGVGLEVLLPAVEAAAHNARVPVAMVLDHATTLEATIQGIKLGCNGVMIDCSDRELSENISCTTAVVAMAQSCGIPVEAELGCVPDADAVDGVHLTTVEEAKGFVQRTGIDFLAVSIGTVHGRLKGRPRLDSTRLRQINEALSIPLVIHGGTGLDEAQIHRLVTHGAAKINFFTALDEAAGAAISKQKGRFTERTQQVIEIITNETENYIRWCGAAGRAAEVITQCRPTEPIEHLIIYNLSHGFEHQAEELMQRGREVLSTIPGVRKVVTGTAVQEDAAYRLCWLVRFVSPAVIANYRDHPNHVAYANRHFRPKADDRISIDYRLNE